MRKLVLSLLSTLFYIFVPSLAYAQAQINASVNPCSATNIADVKDQANLIATLCKLGLNPSKTIGNLIFFVVLIAIVVALLYLLYGGVKWITSRGEKDQVEAARNHIIAAIVGLIVVFLAIFVLSIILAAFGITFDKLVIPTIL